MCELTHCMRNSPMRLEYSNSGGMRLKMEMSGRVSSRFMAFLATASSAMTTQGMVPHQTCRSGSMCKHQSNDISLLVQWNRMTSLCQGWRCCTRLCTPYMEQSQRDKHGLVRAEFPRAASIVHALQLTPS